MCGIKASAEQKKKLEEMTLEWLELCREKELYRVHDSIEDLIRRAMNTMLLSINLKSQRLNKERHEVKNIVEQAPKRRTRLTKCLKNFKVIHNESIIPLNKTPQISSVIANTPDLPTKEPEYSLSMGDEHLSTIPETESNEVIKSSVKNLVPIPSESEIIDSSPKFDYLLKEFSGELAHIDPTPPGIEEADFDLEEEIRLVENLIDSHLEEIDLFLATNDLMSPGIKNDDYDSKRDIYFLEELLSNDPLPENESSNFDHHDDSSFSRPLPKPPDVEVFFDFEPDTGVLTTKVDKITFDFSESPMMIYGGDIPLLDIPIAPDFEASRARGFVHRPLEFQSLVYGNPIS
uniref:Reverse transcriptase domain-containing protein n=1 Tax=Tanacetum cinerariifolium TaxID=118510 RepID=A0A699GRI2_TANCI|nr:hypothetical protein [Tanacetum cinerariifolium]